MALTFVAAGAWAASASTSAAAAPALPTGWAAGDVLVLIVHWKQKGATLTTPTGWTPVGSPVLSANGAAYGAGAGDTATAVFYTVATAGQTAPTIPALTGGGTANTTGNVMEAMIVAYRADSQSYQVVASYGAQSTSALAWSIVGGAADYAVSDALFISLAMSLSTTTVTAPNVAIPGCVLGGISVGTKGASTTGADIGAYWYRTSINGGSGTTPTMTATQSASTYGTGVTIGVRELPLSPVSKPVTLNFNDLQSAPDTVTVQWNDAAPVATPYTFQWNDISTLPTLVHSGTNISVAATNITYAVPANAGIAAGDVILVAVTTPKSTSFTATGFTNMGGRSNDATDTFEILRRVADGTENGATYTFNATGVTSARFALNFRVYRNVDANSATETVTNIATSTTYTGAAATAPAKGVLVAFYGGVADTAGGQGTWTAPAGYGNALTVTNTNASGTNVNLGSSDLMPTTDTATTPSATVSTSTSGALIEVVITAPVQLSPVSQQSSIVFNDLALASLSGQELWNVTGRVLKPSQELWNYLAALTQSRQEVWNITGPVSKTGQDLWNVLAVASQSRQELWNTTGRVVDTTTENWNVNVVVSQSRQELWNDGVGVAAAKQELWNTLGAVSKSGQELWNAMAVASQSRQELWNTLIVTSQSRQELWNALASASKSRQELWNVLAVTSQSRQELWNALAVASQNRQELWNTRATVASSKQELWNALSVASQARQELWNTRAVASLSRQELWNTAAVVSQSRQELWNSLSRVSTSKQTLWLVRALVNKTAQELWQVLSTTSASKQELWNIAAALSGSESLVWNDEQAIAALRSFVWKVLSHQTYPVRGWSGTAWVPGILRVWDGGQWKQPRIAVWNGSNWV